MPADQTSADAPVKRRRRRKTPAGVAADAQQQVEVGIAAAVAASEATVIAGEVWSATNPAFNLVSPDEAAL